MNDSTRPAAQRAGATGFPLAERPVTCMLPVQDLERARRYYAETLRLTPIGQQADGKFLFRAGATEIALFPKAPAKPAEHTALSFRVDDVAAAIAALQAQGVVFDEYDLPGLKTVDHVCVLGSEKAAWFRDPDGNILCLHEDLA
jgi:catechol 2,3-dioxygenase-like lactoylglutathione lyase family enzyme